MRDGAVMAATATPDKGPCAGTAAPEDLFELRGWRRPRLRHDVPILWRTATSIQIGDDVTLTEVTRAHVAWMTSLDGLNDVRMIVESLTIPAGQAARLVRALIAAGALEDASRIPASVRWASPDARDDAHRRFGAALATYRQLDQAHDAMRLRDRRRIAVHGTGPVASAVRSALTTAGLTPHEPSVDHHPPDLTIIADVGHPDVPSIVEHPLLHRPHVRVSCYGAHGGIGPLVVPGVTSCLRCRHLHRRDADPAWPLLSVQWAQWAASMHLEPVDPLLAQTAATWVTLLARAWVDQPDVPELWGDRAMDIHLPDGNAVYSSRPTHPLCGCHWATRESE